MYPGHAVMLSFSSEFKKLNLIYNGHTLVGSIHVEYEDD